MFAQAILFLINDIYMVYNDIGVWLKETCAMWVYVITLIGTVFFMMQHTLFVGQYVRVALALPDMFCL